MGVCKPTTTITLCHKSEQLYNYAAELQLGDHVHVIKPKKGQGSSRTVKGFCANGKTKIHTDKDQ